MLCLLEKDTTGQKIVVFATTVADHFSPRPDMVGYTSIYRSKNGTPLHVLDTTRTWDNIGAGLYAITLETEDVDTVGPLVFYIYGQQTPDYCDPIRALAYVRERTEANVRVGDYYTGMDPATQILSDSTNRLFTDESGRVATIDGGVVTLADGAITAASFDQTTAYPQIVANVAEQILITPENLLFTDESGYVNANNISTDQTSAGEEAILSIVDRIQFTPENEIITSFEGTVPSAQEIADALMSTHVDGTVDVGLTLKRLLAIGSGKITVENGNIFRFYAVDSSEEVFSVIINQFTRTPL